MLLKDDGGKRIGYVAMSHWYTGKNARTDETSRQPKRIDPAIESASFGANVPRNDNDDDDFDDMMMNDDFDHLSDDYVVEAADSSKKMEGALLLSLSMAKNGCESIRQELQCRWTSPLWILVVVAVVGSTNYNQYDYPCYDFYP